MSQYTESQNNLQTLWQTTDEEIFFYMMKFSTFLFAFPDVILFLLHSKKLCCIQFQNTSITFFSNIFSIVDGRIEIYSKHDHTQYKLLASVDDPKFSATFPINYISLASFNSTPIQLFHDCSMAPPFIDTQLATKYATIGHPLLLEDPTFVAPIDKRNCK